MSRFQLVISLFFILLVAHTALCQSPNTFSSSSHGIKATIPDGWRTMEALTSHTALKVGRVGASGSRARITIVVDDYLEYTDVTTISRHDLLANISSDTIAGESVKALDAGVGGLHAVWTIAEREVPVPGGGSTIEYTYELLRQSPGLIKGYTIRLTSYGDKNWYQSNAVVFDTFLNSIVFDEQLEVTHAESQNLLKGTIPLTQQPDSQPMSNDFVREYSPLETGGGDSFIVALFKSWGKVFLIILAASIAVGVAKAAMSSKK